MEQQRPDAVLVSGEGDLYANRQLIAELAEKNRLPVMCPYRDYVEAGGLMAYAVDLAELLSRMADNVHQILKGAKPGDIPISAVTKWRNSATPVICCTAKLVWSADLCARDAGQPGLVP